MSAKFAKPAKKPKALWMRVNSQGFKAQAQALRPENTLGGGVKSRSKPEALRMEVYNAIRELFLKAHEICECNPGKCFCLATQVHHTHGRDGLLLFDVRKWKAACLGCHNWIGDHMDEARAAGLLAAKGEWRKQ